MLYTAGQIVLFLVASAAIGVLVGYFLWKRGSTKGGSDAEVATLQRQLTATRKRAAAAESEVSKRNDALAGARERFEAQQARIDALEAAAVAGPVARPEDPPDDAP